MSTWPGRSPPSSTWRRDRFAGELTRDGQHLRRQRHAGAGAGHARRSLRGRPIAFNPIGGSGSGYLYALTSNLSGGAIDSATGAYTAGATPNVTDVVTVTDGLGNTAMATITVGNGVFVTPASASTVPQGTVALSASGGSGTGYTFAVTTNASGGAVDPSSGRYLAGLVPSVTDSVTVTDSLGNTAIASIFVGAGVTLTAAGTTPPRGTLALSASGGSGSYPFTLQSNGSGASIVSTTGVYTAGAAGNTSDTVVATDSLGNLATLQIAVGAGVTITPSAPVVPPGGTLTFAASGGSGAGYVFSLTANGSGGVIDPASGVYLAGAVSDVDDAVTVTDSFGNTNVVDIVVGNGVGLSPHAPTVPPRGAVQFTAVGGSGAGYVFTLSAAPSGGTIDAGSGLYKAGPTPNVTDQVTVVDSLGKVASALITVGPGVTITPAATNVSPSSMLTFSVTGGSGGGYPVHLAPASGSGAMIDAAHGKHTPGGRDRRNHRRHPRHRRAGEQRHRHHLRRRGPDRLHRHRHRSAGRNRPGGGHRRRRPLLVRADHR